MTSCKFFAAGYCKRGESCRYSHETTPASNTAAPPPPPLYLNRSKEIASHSSQARSWREPFLFIPSGGSAKSSLSIEAPNNSLAFRSKRTYSLQPTQDSRSQVPCRYYTLGTCRNGSACPYSHNERDEQEMEAISDPEVHPLQTYLAYPILNVARRTKPVIILPENFVARWLNSSMVPKFLRFLFLETSPLFE